MEKGPDEANIIATYRCNAKCVIYGKILQIRKKNLSHNI